MTQPQVAAIDKLRPGRIGAVKLERYLYSGAAALLLVVMFLGFQQFYLHGKAFPNRDLTPPIKGVLIAHGVAMTLWMALFMVQPLLIVNRKHRLHMTLGKIGAGLAACIVVLGLWVGVRAAQVNPPEAILWGLNPHQFLIVPISAILMFGTFVAIGVWKRKKPAIHRPMMLLATLSAIAAAVDRIPAIQGLYSNNIFGTIWGPYFGSLAIGAIFLAASWAMTRKFDKWFGIGFAALAVASGIFVQLAPTALWEAMTAFLF